jgi:hypothetical protein
VPLASHKAFTPHVASSPQAAEQQTEGLPEPVLTQLPDPQSVPAKQVWPFFFLHFCPLHAYPAPVSH